MEKKEFRKQIIPLTEKELNYRKHPEKSSASYDPEKSADNITDGILSMNLDPDYMNEEHAQLLPMQKVNLITPNLHFSKQTRYSVVPLHRHSYIEMNYMYSGTSKALINGKEITLETGDVCIMDTGVIHTILPTEENDLALNCLMKQSYFNKRFTERLNNSGMVAKFIADTLNSSSEHNQYLIFHTANNPLIQELFEDVFCEYLDPGLCSEAILDSYMTMIFIQLARCYQDHKEREYRSASKRYLSEVLRYMEEHCTECTLNKTAEQFGFHPNYLSRAIKNATGKTFKEVVDQNRLAKAVFLLENTGLTITDIAIQCGWSNIKHFYKKFNETYACTPKEYRLSRSSDETFVKMSMAGDLL